MKKKIRAVYVAGAYTGLDKTKMHNGMLGNIRRGMELSVAVLKAGHAPFCPWFDYQFSFFGEFPVSTMYTYSMRWLEASEAVLVVQEGWETSKGTKAEIGRADELGIPVFHNLHEMLRRFHDEDGR